MTQITQVTLPIKPQRISDDDKPLVLQASKGDQHAFKQLYQHHRRVFAICFRLCSNHSQAEEMTQNCFVRVWQKLPQFNGNSLFTTWLHRLCIRQAINDLKA